MRNMLNLFKIEWLKNLEFRKSLLIIIISFIIGIILPNTNLDFTPFEYELHYYNVITILITNFFTIIFFIALSSFGSIFSLIFSIFISFSLGNQLGAISTLFTEKYFVILLVSIHGFLEMFSISFIFYHANKIMKIYYTYLFDEKFRINNYSLLNEIKKYYFSHKMLQTIYFIFFALLIGAVIEVFITYPILKNLF